MKLRYQILICAVLTFVVVSYELGNRFSRSSRMSGRGSTTVTKINNHERRINDTSAILLTGDSTSEIVVDGGSIQLQGNLNDGLVLLPSFQVSGYQVVEPGTVKFRLISYSTQHVYPELQVFTIYDGERALLTTVPRKTASSPATAENGTATVAYEIDVPYVVFLRMCESDSPDINLGIGKIGLSGKALENFRDMKAFVDQGVTFPGWTPASR